MDIVNSCLDELDMRKWIVKSEEGKNAEEEIYNKIVWSFQCENDFWTWDIEFRDDSDCEPGILGLHNIKNKKDEIFFKNYQGDLLNQNSSSTIRENNMFLLKCESLQEYFELRFSKYEKLEKLLEKYFIVKVTNPFRKMHFHVNKNGYIVYYIDLFNKENLEELCTLVLLPNEYYINSEEDEEKRNYKYREENEEIEYKFEYRIFIYPSMKKINMIRKGKMIGVMDNWDRNSRNLYIRRFGIDSIPYYSFKYEDLPVWNKKLHKKFPEEFKNKVLTLLCIQRFYKRYIDKNIFFLIIELLSTNYYNNLHPFLEEIEKLSLALKNY
jgi:hypothetical protein